MTQGRLPPGMMRQGTPILGGPPPQQQQAPPTKPSFAEANPIPHGPKGMQTLRAVSDCEIVKEAEAFKNVIPKLQYLNADIEDLLELYGQGVSTIVGADHYCNRHTSTRTAVTFSEDPTLDQIHKDLQSTVQELQELMQKMGELRQKAGVLNEKRWEHSVKVMGLNPEERFYRIDEEKGIIEQVDLKCRECKGATRARKLRQELTDKLMRLEYVKEEEPKDDGPGTRSDEPEPQSEGSGEDGEASVQEQEVSGMAAPADHDDGDGDNGSGETA